MSKRDVLLAILNFSELKDLANNAKMRSSLKFLLVRYVARLECSGQFLWLTLCAHNVHMQVGQSTCCRHGQSDHLSGGQDSSV